VSASSSGSQPEAGLRVQLLSDLHLETEAFEPEPAPGAELLVLAGDIDATWLGFDRFLGWPVPVVVVAGNHEFDGRELNDAWPALRERCAASGLELLEREERRLVGADGRRIRLLATIRWSDYDTFGDDGRARAMRASQYFQQLMHARRGGSAFDPHVVREEALACRDWLHERLCESPSDVDATLVVTHFAPSLRSADPRYGAQAGSASFCNADDDLLPRATVWLHGHVHARHDWRDGARVVSNARGHSRRGEAVGHDPLRVIDV
jgi:hypothetical protein